MLVVLLLPLGAALSALLALAILGHRLEHEMSELRRSLRLVGATAVAADELSRTGARVADHAVDAREQVRLRVRRPRPTGRRHPR